MAERKLDIFEVLNAINAKDVGYYDQLTADEAKTIQPLVLMRWLSGTSDEQQIMMLNEFANPAVFPLAKHKKLLWQLLTVCNTGTRKRYNWPKDAGKRAVSKPIATGLVQRKYGYNSKHAQDAVTLLADDAIYDMAFDEGMSGEEMTKLKKELKK